MSIPLMIDEWNIEFYKNIDIILDIKFSIF